MYVEDWLLHVVMVWVHWVSTFVDVGVIVSVVSSGIFMGMVV